MLSYPINNKQTVIHFHWKTTSQPIRPDQSPLLDRQTSKWSFWDVVPLMFCVGNDEFIEILKSSGASLTIISGMIGTF